MTFVSVASVVSVGSSARSAKSGSSLPVALKLICDNLLAVVQAAMQSVYGTDKIEAGISPYYLADEVRRVYEGMMIAIPLVQWQPFAQLERDSIVQCLQQLAAQMEA